MTNRLSEATASGAGQQQLQAAAHDAVREWAVVRRVIARPAVLDGDRPGRRGAAGRRRDGPAQLGGGALQLHQLLGDEGCGWRRCVRTRPAVAGEPAQRERRGVQLLRVRDSAKWVMGGGMKNRLPEAGSEGHAAESEPPALQVCVLDRLQQGERHEDVLPTELQLQGMVCLFNKESILLLLPLCALARPP